MADKEEEHDRTLRALDEDLAELQAEKEKLEKKTSGSSRSWGVSRAPGGGVGDASSADVRAAQIEV